MKVLVDEMYPAAVADELQAVRIEATTVTDLRLAGAPDPEVLRAAAAAGYPGAGPLVPDAPRLGRFAPDVGMHTEFPHIGPLWTEMFPGGPQPFVHHEGAWIWWPQTLLALTKNGLLGSMPAACRFSVSPVPGSG